MHPRSFVFLSSSSVDKDVLDDEPKSTLFHIFETNTYESSLQALRAYHKLNGDLVIPRSFIVPYIEGWFIASFNSVAYTRNETIKIILKYYS